MTVPYIITIMHDVTADADGDIEITMSGGYHGEDVDRIFTVEEMRRIAIHAEAHKQAYEDYRDSDYEDEDTYFKAMKEFE